MDKHHLRKSADRKEQIRKAFVWLNGLNCAFRSADFLRWCLSSERNLTHNLFLFPIVFGVKLIRFLMRRRTVQEIPSLESRRQYQSAILGFQLANKTAPQHLLNECFPPASQARSLRQRNHFKLPTPHITLYQSSPIYFAAHTFNELPKHLQSITNLSEFKRRAQQHFLSYSCPCSNHPNRSA